MDGEGVDGEDGVDLTELINVVHHAQQDGRGEGGVVDETL